MSKKHGLLCVVGFVVTMFLIFTSLQLAYQPINVVVDVNVDQSAVQQVQHDTSTSSHLQSIREIREYATTGSEIHSLFGDIVQLILMVLKIVVVVMLFRILVRS